MRRREFVTLLGGATAMWPLATRAQHPTMPVIGVLDPRSPEVSGDRMRGFRQGLKETGYVEGENVAIEYRWAENQSDRVPTLAADLVRRRAAVIVTTAPPSALAAKALTTTIPRVHREKVDHQIAEVGHFRRFRDVRVSNSGSRSHRLKPTLSATSGLMHRSKRRACGPIIYSMTSSAIESTPDGTSMPSARAVWRLMTNLNLVDWMTGKSTGFAPLRILPV
jgi:ABC transporter substrate binding protein